ncbi:MAG: nitroreductase family protein [Syntrophales bacterium]|nr:nitroreductase family protein [Syntrophales bacterium]MDD5643672.1 nitroreductase family protein [Syntrophales bacterium]
MDLYEAIHKRRSHRFYKPEMPPREVLERVIDAGLWAPSGTNAQAWEIAVLAGKAREEFVELASGAIPYMEPILEKAQIPEDNRKLVKGFFKNLGGAPVVIAVTVPRPPDATMDMAIIQSGAALMQNLLLAAHAEGLGTCWMTGILFVEKQLLDYLGKSDQRLLAITPIGYSAKEPPVPPRKDREVRWLGF